MSEQLDFLTDETEPEEKPENQTEPEAGTPEPVQVVVTNRYNLNEFRSRRLIVPRSAFSLYFEDLFEITPNHIPIFQTPISEDLLAKATSTGENNYPILIEIKTDNDGDPVKVISFDDVVAFHFRSEGEAKDFPRSFGNIPEDTTEYKVSPQLFGQGSQKVSDLERIAESLADDTDLAERVMLSDKWSGAITCAIRALDHLPGPLCNMKTIKALAQILNNEDWVDEDTDFLEQLRQYRTGKPSSDQAPSKNELGQVLLEDFTYSGIPKDGPKYVASLSEKYPEMKALARAVRMLDPKRSKGIPRFVGFENDVEKALLLTLTSKTLDGIIKKSRDKNAEPIQLLIASILFGLATGRHQLPVEVRPETLDRTLAQIELSAIDETGDATTINVVEHQKGYLNLFSFMNNSGDELLNTQAFTNMGIIIAELHDRADPGMLIEAQVAAIADPNDPRFTPPDQRTTEKVRLERLCEIFAEENGFSQSVTFTRIDLQTSVILSQNEDHIEILGGSSPQLHWEKFLEKITSYDPCTPGNPILDAIKQAHFSFLHNDDLEQF